MLDILSASNGASDLSPSLTTIEFFIEGMVHAKCYLHQTYAEKDLNNSSTGENKKVS